MKQLVYGGILMITGMLGVIAAILALSVCCDGISRLL